ncbi:MAG: HD domain-containing protein [Pseudolysinimonas sp.]
MDTPLALAALELARLHEVPSVLNHSIRTHAYAVLHAEKTGLTGFDPELLYVACVLHDLGASDAFDGPQRFEVEAADAAAGLVREHGRTEGDADQVWQAIALHTSPGIAERRGPIPLLTRVGVRIDFASITIPAADRTAMEAAHPRLGLDTDLGTLVAAQAVKQPEKARASSWAADLVRQLHPGAPGPAPWAHPAWMS